MGANFTPAFGAYSPLTPFRYWCQKVLPLVYDDSLSYYECLNKTVDYLNKTMEDVETLHEDTEAMLAAFNQLQTYVNTYFDELDLTEEVQTVLDRMAENGSLDALLAPLVGEQIGDVVAEQIDDVVANQIYATVAEQINGVVNQIISDSEIVQDSVTDWLNEHVTSGDIIVDDSLSISGAAADAKVTGEKISKINNKLSMVIHEGNISYITDWTQGYIRLVDGTSDYNDTTACRTPNATLINGYNKITIAPNLKLSVFEYTGAQSGYIGRVLFNVTNTVDYNFGTGHYFKFQLRKTDDTDLSPTDISATALGYASIYTTDKTLSVENFPADSATVGNILLPIKDCIVKEITNQSITRDGFWINSDGNLSVDNSTKIAYIPCYKGVTYEITAENYSTFRVGISRWTPSNGLSLADFRNTNDSKKITADRTGYLVIYTYPSLVDFKAYKYVTLDDIKEANEANLHDFPISTGVYNVIKRAKQGLNVKWIPAANLPRVYLLDGTGSNRVYKGQFSEGKQYTGVPYSQADYPVINNYGYTSGDVGSYISFDTFISACENKNSIMYNVPIDSYEYRSTFYGLVCCSFLHMAFNLPTNETYTMTNLQNENLYIPVNSSVETMDNKLIRTGIFVQKTAHVALITDVYRNSDGTVSYIEVTEQSRAGNASKNVIGGLSGGITRCKLWSIKDFREHFGDYSAYIYRYIDDVPFEQKQGTIPFKDNTELYMPNTYPCIPYVGNKFTYRKDYLYNKNILIDSDDYTHVRVKKDNEQFALIEINNSTSVNIPFTDTGYYKAYLCNIDSSNNDVNSSIACEWAVVDCSVSASVNGNDITIVTDVTSDDVPYIVRIATNSNPAKYRDSNFAFINEPTVEELSGGKKRYTFTVQRQSAAKDCIRIEYQGKYNKWHSDWLVLT